MSFVAGDTGYGKVLSDINHEDENYWLDNSGKILARANTGSSAAKVQYSTVIE